MNEKNRLLNEVRKLDFALLETALYLDCHPTDAEALAYFSQTREKKQLAVSAYEEKYGPLTKSGDPCRGAWRWSRDPFPWEEE